MFCYILLPVGGVVRSIYSSIENPIRFPYSSFALVRNSPNITKTIPALKYSTWWYVQFYCINVYRVLVKQHLLSIEVSAVFRPPLFIRFCFLVKPAHLCPAHTFRTLVGVYIYSAHHFFGVFYVMTLLMIFATNMRSIVDDRDMVFVDIFI